MEIKASKMDVGDYGVLDGDVVRLRNQGKQGGATNNLYLAYVCDVRDSQQLERESIKVNTLPDVINDLEED